MQKAAIGKEMSNAEKAPTDSNLFNIWLERFLENLLDHSHE